jgi:hypothetical protein
MVEQNRRTAEEEDECPDLYGALNVENTAMSIEVCLFLSFLISKSRMCLLSDLSFVFFLARNFSSSSSRERNNDDAREARIRS